MGWWMKGNKDNTREDMSREYSPKKKFSPCREKSSPEKVIKVVSTTKGGKDNNNNKEEDQKGKF